MRHFAPALQGDLTDPPARRVTRVESSQWVDSEGRGAVGQEADGQLLEHREGPVAGAHRMVEQQAGPGRLPAGQDPDGRAGPTDAAPGLSGSAGSGGQPSLALGSQSLQPRFLLLASGVDPASFGRLADPVGPLGFAGKATCRAYPATVYGAYLSGIPEAERVLGLDQRRAGSIQTTLGV